MRDSICGKKSFNARRDNLERVKRLSFTDKSTVVIMALPGDAANVTTASSITRLAASL